MTVAPPPLARHHRESSHPVSKLARLGLSSAIVRTIHAGKGYQSSVYLVEVEGRVAAVKDYARAPKLFRRLVAPCLLRREARALRYLHGTPGVPEFYGFVDRFAITIEYVEGTPLAQFGPGELSPEVFERVRAAIDSIHARGVSHGDLKRRSNLLLTSGGEVYLIDFAASLIRRPFSPVRNWLQREMARVDDKAVPRLKKFVAPELLTPAEKCLLNTPTTLEKLARRLLNR